MSRSNNDGNWLDRDEAADPTLIRVLAFYLGLDPATVGTTLDEHATAIYGMVIADANELQVVSYLKRIEAKSPLPPPVRGRRAAAVALWHVAKAASLRDELNRLKARWREEHPGPSEPLSEWLAERILRAPGGGHDADPGDPSD
jgi:hypothetical protein